jgi:hypothetical protein
MARSRPLRRLGVNQLRSLLMELSRRRHRLVATQPACLPTELNHPHRHPAEMQLRWRQERLEVLRECEICRFNRGQKTVKGEIKAKDLPFFVIICTLVNEMLSLLVWRMGLLLELAILIRAVATKTVAKFPYFCAYILCVFCVSAALEIPYVVSPGLYYKWYWPTQFATLVAGCGVIFEILRHALEAYPGAERVARVTSLAIFAFTFLYVGFKAAMLSELTPLAVTVELERDLRTIQALLLASVLTIVVYYRIEIGRNVKGLIVGFGVYVGTSLVTLAVRAFLGPRFNAGWEILQSGSYLFALTVWMVALWSYYPQPVPLDRTRLDADYEALAGSTREILQSLRSYLRRTVRS